MRNCACYYFSDVTEIEDFDFGDILFDEKSYENILIDDVLYKFWLVQNFCILCLIKYMGLLEIIMELNV